MFISTFSQTTIDGTELEKAEQLHQMQELVQKYLLYTYGEGQKMKRYNPIWFPMEARRNSGIIQMQSVYICHVIYIHLHPPIKSSHQIYLITL